MSDAPNPTLTAPIQSHLQDHQTLQPLFSEIHQFLCRVVLLYWSLQFIQNPPQSCTFNCPLSLLLLSISHWSQCLEDTKPHCIDEKVGNYTQEVENTPGMSSLHIYKTCISISAFDFFSFFGKDFSFWIEWGEWSMVGGLWNCRVVFWGAFCSGLL